MATQTESAGTLTDIIGITLTFTLARTAQVVFFYQTAGFVARDIDDATGQACRVALVVDGAEVGTTMELQGHRYLAAWGAAASRGSTDLEWNTGSGEMNMSHYVATLSSGSHTVKMQMHTSDAGLTAYVFRGSTRLSYLVLGK